jgi:hypothetical protein
MDLPTPIRIEGMTAEEVLALPSAEVRRYLADGAPLVLQVGTSQVLAEFSHRPQVLHVVLAHIDGGGEGVLRLLHRLLHAHARREGLARIHWTVTAVNCASPNAKLGRLLNRMAFRRQATPAGEAYVRVDELRQA